MKRRILSIITALALCLGMCPPVAVAAAEEIDISKNLKKILTAEDSGCPGHTFMGTAQAAMIYVESGTHDVTFADLNITASAMVGVAPDAAMNLTIDGTNTIHAGSGFAGIYVPVGATLIINGNGSLNVSGSWGGAGIGGGIYDPSDPTGTTHGDPNCGTVEINGGTITATGGDCAAGIGGGMDTENNPGNGGTVTINGGTVTATGGRDQSGYFGGAGIGGGSGDTAGGSGGTLTINGGHVTLTPGAYGTDWGAAYGFGQGSGSAPGGTCELTLADTSCLAEGTTLDPNGKYTINGDPTEDMIVVPEDLIYSGKAQELDGKIYIDDSKTGTGTYFGQTFTVNASADGWTYTIDPAVVKAAGDYTVTFSKEGHTSISKTFTVAQSGTQFVEDGEVKTYNGETQTDTFTADDAITVKATPTATGAAPDNSAMFAASFTPPTTGQMAVFVGDTQVSEAVGVDEDGSYTMTVSAADVLLAAGGPATGITLTAKFVENDNMADGTGTVKVNITAVAVAEKDGKVIGYYGESSLAAAFAADSGNAGATFTLLSDVERLFSLEICIDCTLDLNGHTITTGDNLCVSIQENTSVTIRGEGEIISKSIALSVDGSVTLEGGTYTSTGSDEISYGVYVGKRATLSVTGEKVVIRNKNGGSGLAVDNAQSVRLSAGTYSGGAAAIESSEKLPDMLAHTDNTRYAYYQNGIPVTKASAWVDNNIGDVPLDTPIAWLSGTVTVQECTHTGEGVCTYTHNENTSTHTKTCLACGYTETGDCGFEKTADPTADSHTGQCPYCKRDQSGAHSFSEWSGNPVARACTVCGYEQTAVAKVEKSNGGGTEYITAKGLNTVFAYNSGYEDATVTLLDDLTNTDYENLPKIDIRCTLNLNGHTIRSDLSSVPTLEVIANGNVTIAGSGEIVSSKDVALKVVGTAVLEGGTFCSGGTYHGAVEVLSGNLSVTGENVVMENTGSGNGLLIYNLEAVRLSAGKYSGAAGAISVSTDAFTLSSLLNQEGASRVAYYKDNATLVTEGLDGQTLPSGSYTVKACTHAYQYTHTTGATTHSQTCPACGDAKAAETCSYDAATGRCACGSTLAVTLPADLALTYDGTAKTPAVTVTVDGTELAAEKYQINYDNNINAGNTAKVTVTAANGSFSGSASTTFTIKQADLTIKASDQTITYGGSIATGADQVTATVLASGDTLESVTLTPSTANVPGGTIKPTGAVIKRGGEDVTANYTIAYQEGTLTINKAQAAVTGNPTANTLTYTGAAQALVTAGTASVGEVVYSLTETGTYSTTIPTGTDADSYTVWYKVEGTTNYEGTALASVDVTIAQATAPAPQTGTLNVQNGYAREYTYDLSRLLPVLASGQSFGGEVTYTLKTVNITEAGYYDIDTAAISGTTLTLPVKAVTSSDEGQIGTITVTISSKNFADVDATINVNRVNKQPVSIEGVTVQNGTYNGSTHNGYTGTPTASPYSGSFTTTYATADGTALSGPPTNAGNYTVTIAVPDKDETYAGSITLNFRISKAQVLIIADDKEVVVGGARPSFTYTITGLLGSDKLTTNPTLTSNVKMSEVGVYTITPGGADAGGNYDINYGAGTLFVKAADVEIQSKVESKGLTDVPTGLAGTEFKTVESIKTELTKTLVTNTGYTETNAAHYDVTLQYSLDGGNSWIPATEDNFPMAGITIVLPYPEGTGRSTHDFVVSHMFTATSAKLGTVAGNTEQPPVTKLDNGIQVTLKGLSPVAIGYKATSSGGSGSGGGQVSYYSVKVDDSAHGKVTADRTSMYSGGTVTLSVTPDEGYVLDTLTVTDSQGSEIKLSAQGDGKHTFIMPSMAVTVKAVFVPLPDDKEKPCDGGTDCPSRGFTDLGTVGTWYHEVVDYVLRNNLMSGYGSGMFGPDDNLSRAQLAQILYNKEGRPQAERGVFTDVTTGWYASAVNWAAAQGIVAGVGGGRFAPDQPITRQDLAVMLWRYAGSPEPRKNELDFSDAGKVSTYAWRALCWANENGIVSGKGNGILDPRGKATRAEAAAMLMRYLSK